MFFNKNGKTQVARQLVAPLQVITIEITPSDALEQIIFFFKYEKLAQYGFEEIPPRER